MLENTRNILFNTLNILNKKTYDKFNPGKICSENIHDVLHTVHKDGFAESTAKQSQFERYGNDFFSPNQTYTTRLFTVLLCGSDITLIYRT